MKTRRVVSGVIWGLGAGLAAVFLVLGGGVLLLGLMAGEALSKTGSPEGVHVDDMGGLIETATVMITAGGCLTIGLSWLAVRRFEGRPYPGARGTSLFVALSLLLVGVSWGVTRWQNRPVPLPASMAGLEGVWHAAGSPKLTYGFNPDGSLDAWSEAMGGGRFGTWTRSGQTVTVKTVRDWEFRGTLTKSRISGTLSITSTGKPTSPQVWVRDVVP